MNIENNILKYYLRNTYFITGTAYAGKSTTVKMLADRYGMIMCGENYHMKVSEEVAQPDIQPNLCYFKQMKNWEEFVRRTPEEYERWIYDSAKEAAEFEIAELIALSPKGKIIVDTNIPLAVLHKISDYSHVAVMLCEQSMSVERFFDRSDPEKQFILGVIENCDDSDAVMKNYKAGLALINSRQHYAEFANSGFYTVIRDDNATDTKEAVCDIIAKHFGLL